MKLLFLSSLIVLLFSACATEEPYAGERYYNKPQFKVQEYGKIAQGPTIFVDLNAAITELGNQILVNNVKDQKSKKIVLTSFVNLNKFKETSTFGRVASESMINELHIRNFRVLDYRGQSNLSINKTGEFHISRDINKLKSKINEAFVFVGTYSKFDQNSIAINARIMDMISGDVISTGRVIYMYQDCALFGFCQEFNEKMKIIKE